jgi:hypothetical protein
MNLVGTVSVTGTADLTVAGQFYNTSGQAQPFAGTTGRAVVRSLSMMGGLPNQISALAGFTPSYNFTDPGTSRAMIYAVSPLAQFAPSGTVITGVDLSGTQTGGGQFNTFLISSVGVTGPKGDTGSTGATGATGASGAQFILDPVSGVYYRTPTNNITSSGTANVASTNVTYYTPIQFSQSVTLDRIAINTNFTGFSGTASVRLGIFANTNGKPGALILDAGTVAPIATATSYAITISQALSAGIYWVAMNTITAATQNVYYSVANANNNNNIFFGGALSTGASTSSGAMGFTESYTATSAFANAGTVSVTAFTPLTYVRVAA